MCCRPLRAEERLPIQRHYPQLDDASKVKSKQLVDPSKRKKKKKKKKRSSDEPGAIIVHDLLHNGENGPEVV
jgi:spermidine/putrescine-binding protein